MPLVLQQAAWRVPFTPFAQMPRRIIQSALLLALHVSCAQLRCAAASEGCDGTNGIATRRSHSFSRRAVAEPFVLDVARNQLSWRGAELKARETSNDAALGLLRCQSAIRTVLAGDAARGRLVFLAMRRKAVSARRRHIIRFVGLLDATPQ